MTEPKIVSISPAALALADKPKNQNLLANKALYPFDTLNLHESFTLPLDTANLASLQVLVSRKSKKGDKRFVMVKHETLNLVEVARIA